MKGFRFLGVRENRSVRRKPKAGMESANRIHIQPLRNCISERNQPLATGVVCHPDTEQNRPYKVRWPCRELNWKPIALQRELYQCATLLPIFSCVDLQHNYFQHLKTITALFMYDIH